MIRAGSREAVTSVSAMAWEGTSLGPLDLNLALHLFLADRDADLFGEPKSFRGHRARRPPFSKSASVPRIAPDRSELLVFNLCATSITSRMLRNPIGHDSDMDNNLPRFKIELQSLCLCFRRYPCGLEAFDPYALSVSLLCEL